MGNEKVSLQEVLRLADRIGLKEFMDATSGGLEMPLYPTGKRLPRKIVQKILLLRSLVNKPRLLLMEEPWLGLEEDNTRLVQRMLLEEFPATTLIVVTDDESFASKCSKVIRIENGRIQ